MGESLQHPDFEQVMSQAFVQTHTLFLFFVFKTRVVSCPFLLSLGETACAPWELALQTKPCHL